MLVHDAESEKCVFKMQKDGKWEIIVKHGDCARSNNALHSTKKHVWMNVKHQFLSRPEVRFLKLFAKTPHLLSLTATVKQ